MKLQVGVKVLLKNASGRYLFIERREPLADGTGVKWDVPGGRIKPFERLEAALAREVKEEVGIELGNKVTLLKAQDIILPQLDLHVIRLTYATEIEAAVQLGKEHQAFKWASRQEAMALAVDPYLREALEDLWRRA